MTNEKKLEGAIKLLSRAEALAIDAHNLVRGITRYPTNLYVSPDDGTETVVTLGDAKAASLTAVDEIESAWAVLANLLDLSDEEVDDLMEQA
jgi:hypothetical protein